MELKNEKKKKKKYIKIWRLKSVAGQLSDGPKIFVGRNDNLSGLLDSPAVFTKTASIATATRTQI